MGAHGLVLDGAREPSTPPVLEWLKPSKKNQVVEPIETKNLFLMKNLTVLQRNARFHRASLFLLRRVLE